MNDSITNESNVSTNFVDGQQRPNGGAPLAMPRVSSAQDLIAGMPAGAVQSSRDSRVVNNTVGSPSPAPGAPSVTPGGPASVGVPGTPGYRTAGPAGATVPGTSAGPSGATTTPPVPESSARICGSDKFTTLKGERSW